jgi:integrase
MGNFKITRRALDAIRSKGTPGGARFADTSLSGFCATVYGTGKIAFSVRYRVAGRRHSVKLGDYPATMPEDARKAAMAVLGGAARGEDEAAKRQAAREAAEGKAQRVTFKIWREGYVKESAKRLKSTREPERYLAMAGEEWDRRPLEEISVKDVEVFRNRLALRGVTQSNRFLGVLRASFASAVRLGYIERNVVALVQHLPENPPRTRTLTAEEEKRLRKVVSTWVNPFEKTAFTLLVDCGARLSEVLKARWTDFDLDEETGAGTWRIPSPKSGTRQAIPILPHVGAVILKTPKLTDAPYVVTGRVASVHRPDIRKPWKALMEMAKIPSDFHVHDTRRSFGLRATLSVGLFAASKLLRHATTAVTEKVYAPIAPEQMRVFAEEAEEERVKTAAKVLAFKVKK